MRSSFIAKFTFLIALTVAVMSCYGADDFSTSKQKELSFNSGGKFKIVQFTDTHIESGDANDQKTIKLIADILDIEKPDLVVFTGDNIANAKDYKKMLDMCFQPVIDRKIRWAAVLGNHDDEHGHNRKDLMQYLSDMPYSLSQMGPSDIHGYGNYYLTINPKAGGKSQWVLYMLDSNSYVSSEEKGKYDWIHTDQVSWYYNTSKELAKRAEAADKTLNAMAFFHIPLMEYAEAFDNGNVLAGHKFERVCSPKLNSGLFTAMVERGDVKAVFTGHDHVNDYEADYVGIKLCYGRSSGYNTYGVEKLDKGARVIILDENTGTFETRIIEAK